MVREAYPDSTALDPTSEEYDPKSTIHDPRWYTAEDPRWYTVDLKLVRAHPLLPNASVCRLKLARMCLDSNILAQHAWYHTIGMWSWTHARWHTGSGLFDLHLGRL